MSLELDYSTLRGQESMLRDTVRCKAFQKAITDVVTPGCTVLDVGAGTGLLSMFAAQAGAKVVYAVEQTKIAEVARMIVKKNGYSDRITIFQGDMADINLPQKVDVIVSEWLGSYGVDENLLPVVVAARERWLKPGGKMVPESVTAWMAPAFDEILQQEVDFWRSDPYGIDMDLISRARARLMDCFCNHVEMKHLIAEPQMMWQIDCLNCTLEDANRPFHTELDFSAIRDGEFNVIAAWFSSILSNDIVLTNGPADDDTHWGRQVFPVGKSVDVKSGAHVGVDFTHHPRGKGYSSADWRVVAGDYRFHSEGSTILSE